MNPPTFFKHSFPNGKDLYGPCLQKFHRKRQNVKVYDKGAWTVKPEDLQWPSVCFITGLSLDWEGVGKNKATPCFVRKDLTKPWEAGNVFIMSLRGSLLRGDRTIDEFTKIIDFLSA